MTDESLSTARTIDVSAETVFAVLADPTTHQAIDGTGWVRESLDGKRLGEVGQIFRMAMYHDNFGGMHYEIANRVEVFEPPHAIAWLPGQGDDDANLDFGGWTWRYDLKPLGDDRTEVTLTYDWSAVPQAIRDEIQFPPFDPQHLDNSLKHLAELAQARPSAASEPAAATAVAAARRT
ncbi:polyketide cyclase [Mycobacterium sp. SWH-M3]|nr:polyketide cyclase [Mycobacterium sp. SWH-M3]